MPERGPLNLEARPSQVVLRLVTYNIHKGIGGIDRRYRPERIVEVLAGLSSDLIFLQEVDENVPRSRRHRQVDFLGDALGFRHRAFFPNVTLRQGHYGNAILSRYSLDHRENLDLTLPMKKRRSALHVRVNLELFDRHLRLWLFNIHLGLAEFERRRQLRRILEWQRQHHKPRDAASIIAGDFNDVWGRLGRLILEPAGYEGTRRSLRTFPARRPLRPLDRAFVEGPLNIAKAYRSGRDIAREASDHCPLIVDFSA